MDNIKLLNPSDIISESMNTINENFRAIASSEDVTEYKLLQFSKDFRKELDDLKAGIDYMQLGILNSVDKLNDRITTLPSMDNIQSAIDAAISNANINIEEFITLTARTEVGSALGGYAKTSYVDGKISNISSAFTSYKANAEKKQAEASMVVANSTFLRDGDGRFIWKESGEPVIINGTDIISIEGYYNYLNADDKSYVDRDSEYENKLDDSGVIVRLAQLCQERFKLVATELASISMAVEDGVSATAIVNAIKGTPGAENDGDIVAAIFMEANRDTGSQITLNADRIAINSTNFTVNPTTHDVTVKGKITATSLVIGGNDLTTANGAKAFVQTYQSHDGGGESGGDDTDDSAWLTGAFKEINAADGVLLAGNLLVGNSEGNVTAGMMGASNDNVNDLRFWAGSDFRGRTSAPFQVYEDGHVVLNDLELSSAKTKITKEGKLIANGAEITGDITAGKFIASNDYAISTDDGYTGNINMTTNIDSNSFNITLNGNLTGSGNTKFDTSSNSLSIEIIKRVENTRTDISGQYLYCVPTLCLTYQGVPYILDPNTLKRLYDTSGGDSSNMRFIQRYSNVIHCGFNTPTNTQKAYCIDGGSMSGGISGYYIFRQEDKKHNDYSYMTWGIENDTVYQFDVLNWGSTSVTSTQLQDTYHLISAGSNGSTVTGSYTLKSLLGEEGLKYANVGGTITNITPGNCSDMMNYLPTQNSGNLSLSLKKTYSVYSGTTSTIYTSTDWGCKNIIKMMKDLLYYSSLGAGSSNRTISNNYLFKSNYFSRGTYYQYVRPCNFENKLSFDDTLNQINVFDMNFEYYPICTINVDSNNGYNTHSKGTDTILAKVNVKIITYYTSNKPSVTIDYDSTRESLDPINGEYQKICNLERIELSLDFNVILKFSQPLNLYDPSDSSTDVNVRNKIKSFLESYNFNDIKLNHSIDYNSGNDYDKYIHLSADFYCSDGVEVKLEDRYN